MFGKYFDEALRALISISKSLDRIADAIAPSPPRVPGSAVLHVGIPTKE